MADRAAAAPHEPATPATCPSCAFLIDPPPARNRRCPRCRQPIVVRRIEGRTVYLTEAAVEVFEAERRRTANLATWTRQRDEWLGLARRAGAPGDRLERIAARPLDEAAVAAARAEFVSLSTRDIRAATKAKQWDLAARRGQELAVALHHAAATQDVQDEDARAIYRAAMVARLRALRAGGTHAELVGSGCCAGCRADDGKVFPVADEIRVQRLPHDDCPRGLCPCEWWLASAPARRRRRKGTPRV